MTAKKKRKPRKRNNQPNTALAKRQKAIIKALSNREQGQPKDLTLWQKISRHKKWIPLPLVLFFCTLYFSFYPNKIIVENPLIALSSPLSSPLIIKNPNNYLIKQVVIDIDMHGAFTAENNMRVSGVTNSKKYVFQKIPKKSSKHLIHGLLEIPSNSKILSVQYSEIVVTISYKTPMIYPDVKKEVFEFEGFLNSNQEIFYLPK